MRNVVVFCAVVWLLILAGCGPSFSWQTKGSWRIEPLVSIRDIARLDDIGVGRDQAHRFRLVVYSVTATNKGRSKAGWVGVEATLHPAFEARIKDRFDFGEHPPLMLGPGGAGTTGATYLLEGTEEEIAALAEQNRFRLAWRDNEQEMKIEIQLTREQK